MQGPCLTEKTEKKQKETEKNKK